MRIADLDDTSHAGAFQGVVCMEVLEHVVALDVVLERLWRLLAADGSVLVSVPVETGLPLIVKQAVRRVAGWRGIGDYPGTSPYRLGEFWSSVTAGPRPHLQRPIYGVDGPMPFHDHKGFNWMVLRKLARRSTSRKRSPRRSPGSDRTSRHRCGSPDVRNRTYDDGCTEHTRCIIG